MDMAFALRPRQARTSGDVTSVLLSLPLLDPLLELAHHVGVAERRHVAELAPFRDVAQQPSHDLPGAGLGQVLGPDDPLRPRELADAVRDVLADVLDQRVVAVPAAGQR